MKGQIVIIHGGDTFATPEDFLEFLKECDIRFERALTGQDDWKPWLRNSLKEQYDVIIPMMPNKTNARFEEWRVWFEKHIPFLRDGVILVGHSLGGSFLAKYLSQHKFPVRIGAVMLVAAVYDKDVDGYPLLSFALPPVLDLQSEHIYLYHSEDDPVVPVSAAADLKSSLPTATLRILQDRGHINQPEFPELLEDIRHLA
jgi:uncharacterized protein